MKKNMLLIMVVLVCMVGAIVCYLPVYLRNKEISDLEKRGNELVLKIEAYKKRTHKLPHYIEDLGLNLPDNYPFSYDIAHDSSYYVVGFEIAPFRSMVYYSDTKTWIPQR